MKYTSAVTPHEQMVLEQISRSEIVAFLRELIRRRSDYPPGDTRAAVQAVGAVLDKEKIPYHIHTKKEHQPNLIASYSTGKNEPTLLYHAHVDTVPAGDLMEWTQEPFRGEVEQGLIYGRGAGDDKGSVAAQVMALVALARAEVPLEGVLQVAVVADEESGALQGTRWLKDSGWLKPDWLVVGEQTDNQIAVAERVACGIDLTIYGKSAHGAMTWEGENAIFKMADVIQWIRKKLLPKLAEKQHPYLPPPTLNIGTISGGEQWSIVPRKCVIEMDRRLIPGETRSEAMDEIRELLEDYQKEVEDIEYELFTTGEVAPNINTSPEDRFVQRAQQSLTDLSGEKRALTGYVQTSDGRWFVEDGIPILIFGPSDPRVGHAADEHVSIDQLFEATRFLTLLALRQMGRV